MRPGASHGIGTGNDSPPQKGGPVDGGYVKKWDTKMGLEGMPALQVIQGIGGDDGTRTRGLMRDRHAF